MIEPPKAADRALSWGRRSLPRLRNKAGLTLEELGERAQIPLKTLRGIEAGRIKPTPSQKQAVRTVAHLAKLYPPNSIVIALDDEPTCQVLRDALHDYAQARRDPAAFVAATWGSPNKRTDERIEQTASAAAKALDLLRRLQERT